MAWFSRLRNLFRSNDLSRDIDREMEFHLAERADDLVAGGMRAEVARFEARRRFGNYGSQKERTRERDVFAFLHTLATDLRYTVRMLRAAPAFALVAILSLALGIGANTAIFTLINTVLLKSLPVSHPEELVLITRSGSPSFTNPLWEAVRDRQDVFSGAAAYGTVGFNLAEAGEIRRVYSAWVAGDFFPMLGVQPALGRLITRSDDTRGCPGVATISAAFWQNEYGGNEGVIGKTIRLDGKPFTIVGVVDPRFSGPVVGMQTNIYVPLCAEALIRGKASRLDERSSWYLQVLARPKAGISNDQVRARISALSAQIVQATIPPNFSADGVARYTSAKFDVEPGAGGFSTLRSQYEKALWVLMAVVALVLLIACANVANLLLARAAAREREMAVRLALGAGRGRLVGQLLTESVVLSLLGAVLGTMFATWGTRVLVNMMSSGGRIVWLDLTVDLRVLSFTIAVATATGILFGLAPAWRSQHVDPHTVMKTNGRGVAEGHSRFSMGKALVTAQIALSLVLVVGAGLLLGSWQRLSAVDPGFRTKGVLVASVSLRASGLDVAQQNVIYRDVLARLRTTPGVVSASSSDLAQVGGGTWNSAVKIAGSAEPGSETLVFMNQVSDQYFATLGTPFVAGRDFNASDVPTSPKVAIVNEAFSRKFFGVASPVGQSFQVREGRDFGPTVAIVGVVKDMKYQTLSEENSPIAFFAANQHEDLSWASTFEIRVDGDPAAAIPSVRSVLTQVAPRATLEFFTLEQRIAETLQLPRTLATLSGFFGGLALLLAAIGLYGIMSYSVTRRRNEIGVRIALGAGQSRVVRMVLGEVSRFVVVGIAAGVLLALAAAKLVGTFLYGVTPSDPVTLAASATVLMLVAIGAALLPATRAARLDPVEALRED